MLKSLYRHIVFKVLSHLLKNRSFFGSSKKEREAGISKSVPVSFHDYLAEVSEEQFLKDLKDTDDFFRNFPNQMAPKNGLVSAFGVYVRHEVAGLLDRIPVAFFTQSTDEKKRMLEETMKLPMAFIEPLSTLSYQEIFEGLMRFLQAIDATTPYLVVQAARDPETQVKADLREYFMKKFPNAFPFFQISKYLYGGLRVFINGQLTDESWLGKIQRFTTQLN